MYLSDSGAVKILAVIIQAGKGVEAVLKWEVLLLLLTLLNIIHSCQYEKKSASTSSALEYINKYGSLHEGISDAPPTSFLIFIFLSFVYDLNQ